MKAKTICPICKKDVEYEIDDDEVAIAVECFAGVAHIVYAGEPE